MENWRKAAVILVGHGSAKDADSSAPTHRMADLLRRKRLFAEVAVCFYKEAPFLHEALDKISAGEVFVVPNFAGEGYYTRSLIPREMGLTGRLTQRGEKRIHYADPVGAHPGIATLLRRRADDIVAANDLDPQDVCLLLIGHGSSRPGGSGGTAERLAERLRGEGRYREVRTAFLEQEPLVADWQSQTRAPVVVALPLLIAQGLHGSRDLPPLFGLEPKSFGRGAVEGRHVWLSQGLGGDPAMIDIILDQVRACSSLAAARS